MSSRATLKLSKRGAVALIVLLGGTVLSGSVAEAVGTSTPAAKPGTIVSFAALNVLNINKADAVSLLGSGVEFDTSKAGPVDLSSVLSPADKSRYGSKLLAGYKEAVGPTVTLGPSDLPYIIDLKSEVLPVYSGNAEALAFGMLSGSGANQIAVNNPNFPKGTYAVIFDIPLSTAYGVFNSKELKIVAGHGNKMAVYLMNFSPVKPGVKATGYAKLFTALEELVSKKVSGSSRSSI